MMGDPGEGGMDVDMVVLRARGLFDAGEDPEPALALVNQILAVKPFHWETMRLRVGILVHAGRSEDAERAALELVAAFPDEPEGYHHLGDLHFRRGDAGRALRCYRTALSRLPGAGSPAPDAEPDVFPGVCLHDAVAACLEALGRPEEAGEWLSRDSRRYPNSVLMARCRRRVPRAMVDAASEP